jgi:hypothetical protein
MAIAVPCSSLYVAFDRGFIGVTAVDGHELRELIAADRLLAKPPRDLCIALLCEEKVDGLAVLIHTLLMRRASRVFYRHTFCDHGRPTALAVVRGAIPP